ncbi:MAG: heavy metal-binding domain-containing protein [Ignavibacteriaceae bacterium]
METTHRHHVHHQTDHGHRNDSKNVAPDNFQSDGHTHSDQKTQKKNIPTDKSSSKEYTCPMHPEVVRNEPGSCPICGMDLVAKKIKKDDDQEVQSYKRMLRRFWVAVLFTVPVFIIAMGELIGIPLNEIANPNFWGWTQFILSTPVLLYSSGDFFKRGYASVRRPILRVSWVP